MKAPIHVHTPGWIAEFKAFIMRGNVVDLAVGIIIGAAFTSIVSSLVKDIFTPIIGLLVGGIDFTNIFITIKGAHEPTLDAAQKAGAVTLNIGLFLNAVIQFLIVAFAIFWVVEGAEPVPTQGGRRAASTQPVGGAAGGNPRRAGYADAAGLSESGDAAMAG